MSPAFEQWKNTKNSPPVRPPNNWCCVNNYDLTFFLIFASVFWCIWWCYQYVLNEIAIKLPVLKTSTPLWHLVKIWVQLNLKKSFVWNCVEVVIFLQYSVNMHFQFCFFIHRSFFIVSSILSLSLFFFQDLRKWEACPQHVLVPMEFNLPQV